MIQRFQKQPTDVLKEIFGHDQFRLGQQEIIESILGGRDVLGVMPTGAGKSVCYQVPALVFEGITLVISPLISLMKDQVSALIESGVSAAYINSTLSGPEYGEILRNARKGLYKLIYIAPERLFTDDFLMLMDVLDIDLVAVDEAHCVSQWGQDFRPSYVRISAFIETLKKRPVVAAFTATATAEVSEDIAKILKLSDPHRTVTGFNRENLTFNVAKPENKFKALLAFLDGAEDRSGIIYCATRKSVEEVTKKLNANGYDATRYHAGLSDEERHVNQDDFIYDRKKIMVATNAFGMGIDKSNVSFVVHYNMPKSLENYYQEAGRAGRDGMPAECLLLYSGQDVRINRFMIEQSDANPELDHFTRAQIKEKDYERLKMMTYYSTTTECLREFILKYFGERTLSYCGNCSSCNTTFETVDITLEAQKIISCVFRMTKMSRNYGKLMISEVLRGSKSEKVIRLRLNELSTYGIMADVPSRRIHKMIDYLVDYEYLTMTDDEYPVILLSSRSNEVIKQLEPVYMKLPKEVIKVVDDEDDDDASGLGASKTRSKSKSKAKSKTKSKLKSKSKSGLSPEDEDLFDQLKALRTEIAARERVPAYIVFADAALRDMCVKRPKTMDDFLEVSGVGKAKQEKFGEAFTDLIRSYK